MVDRSTALLEALTPRFGLFQTRDGISIVEAKGELDLHSAEQLRDSLAEGSRCSSRVLLDLTGVGFADSTTLGVVLQAHGALQGASGMLAVAVGDGEVARTFRLTGFDAILALAPDRRSGLRALRAQPAT